MSTRLFFLITLEDLCGRKNLMIKVMSHLVKKKLANYFGFKGITQQDKFIFALKIKNPKFSSLTFFSSSSSCHFIPPEYDIAEKFVKKNIKLSILGY